MTGRSTRTTRPDDRSGNNTYLLPAPGGAARSTPASAIRGISTDSSVALQIAARAARRACS